MKGAKDGYGAARKTESEKKAELRAVQEKLKAAFTVLEEMGAKRDEEGGGVNALFEEKKALHEEVRQLCFYAAVVVQIDLIGSFRNIGPCELIWLVHLETSACAN